MNYRRVFQEQRHAVILLSLLICLAALCAGSAVWWLWNKQQQLQAHLETVNNRYARLAALDTQRTEMVVALQKLRAVQAQQFHTASSDATQIGNTLQQQVRSIMLQAGLVVSSSQVQVPSDAADARAAELPYESVKVLMSVDGNWASLQKALQLLQALSPAVTVDDLMIQLNGALHAQAPDIEPRLTTRWVLSTLRSKGSV